MDKILDKQEQNLINQIYQDIFCHIDDQYIVVFLCGGASGGKYIRDQVRTLLEQNKRSSGIQLPIKVFYPEELFMGRFLSGKNSNLLTLEQFLAENSHIIAIICESPGSLVELGAFTNNQFTREKVIAAVDKTKAKNKSFIMLGPIKYLKGQDRLNTIEYDASGEKEQMRKFALKLSRNIRQKYSSQIHKNSLGLNTIVGMHYFIMLLLYFFKSVSKNKLQEYIRFAAKCNKVQIEEKDFHKIFETTRNLLFQNKYIISSSDAYELTNSGYMEIERVAVTNYTNQEKCDKIRVMVMYWQLYKSSRP